MPEYKLIYFNDHLRAELTRWIFVYAGIPFKDERIEMADWPAMKGTVPFGKLPVLMIDGKPLPQFDAINRYMAKISGLAPKDDLQSAYCDAVVSAVLDVALELYRVHYNPASKEDKKEEYAQMYAKTVKPFLSDLNKRLSDRDWICTDQITWADLAVGSIFGHILVNRVKFLDDYPFVSRHVKKIWSIPKIKEWVDKWPKVEF